MPPASFKRVVDCWSLAGWVTGGIMAATLWAAAQLFPMEVAVGLALGARLLVTGALHEDGLADFCDGFGGGTSRERILAIMKDSHIGTYGVIGLLMYFGLTWSLLAALPLPLACAAIAAGDPWSKCCAAQIINVLPYARKEEEAKARMVYDRMSVVTGLVALGAGLLPALCLLDSIYWWALLAPAVVCALLIALMHKRIQGYTGDCCGATFLWSELSFYLIINLIEIKL